MDRARHRPGSRGAGHGGCRGRRLSRRNATDGGRSREARRLARIGEEIAAAHLTSHGIEILERNWRAGRAELDIIAREGDVIAFVEVKTRGAGPQEPLEAISPKKKRQMRRAAAAWIARNPGVGREFRFDALGVRLGPGGAPMVDHVRQAFYGDDV